jgi:hypothetical protein
MTVPKEMNAGVELLLKRMETNPEEFTQDHKWLGVIRSYKEYLSEQDLKALDDGINGLMQQKFTEIVLEGLVDPKPSTNLEQLLQAKQNATLSAGVTPARSTATLSNTNLVYNNGTTSWENRKPLDHTLDARAYQMEQMKLHLEAHRAALRAEEQRQHQTLFGRLKNYLHNE